MLFRFMGRAYLAQHHSFAADSVIVHFSNEVSCDVAHRVSSPRALISATSRTTPSQLMTISQNVSRFQRNAAQAIRFEHIDNLWHMRCFRRGWPQ